MDNQNGRTTNRQLQDEARELAQRQMLTAMALTESRKLLEQFRPSSDARRDHLHLEVHRARIEYYEKFLELSRYCAARLEE